MLVSNLVVYHNSSTQVVTSITSGTLCRNSESQTNHVCAHNETANIEISTTKGISRRTVQAMKIFEIVVIRESSNRIQIDEVLPETISVYHAAPIILELAIPPLVLISISRESVAIAHELNSCNFHRLVFTLDPVISTMNQVPIVPIQGKSLHYV